MSYMEDRLKRKNGLLPPLPTRKEKKALNRVSPKKKAADAEAKKAGTDGELDKWFEAKRKQLTGKCALCGGKTEKHNDDTYRRSIHHLLEKRKTMFPSLATHPDNFLEVCFYGNSCHQNIHGGKITFELLKDSAEWPLIEEKLLTLLPLCTEEEKKLKIYSSLIKLVYGK